MRAIILKEFLKFQYAFYAFLALSLGVIVAIGFQIKNGINTYSDSGYMIRVVYNLDFSFMGLDLLNVFFVVLVGVSAFFGERQNARIRIQFHFPNSNLKNVTQLALICHF